MINFIGKIIYSEASQVRDHSNKNIDCWAPDLGNRSADDSKDGPAWDANDDKKFM